MSERTQMNCRAVRKQFKAIASDEQSGAGRHIESCADCAREYRIYTLSRTLLDLAASPVPVRPDEAFFKGLRARIERGPESLSPRVSNGFDESWSGALWQTARQLIPAMAMLLLLIIGATALWSSASNSGEQVAGGPSIRPRERVLFNDIYDYPAPTQDDVLETLVAVEETENGK